MTTAGPEKSAAASPVVTKIPAPTTLAMPSVVRLNVPTAPESSRPRSVLAWARMASRRSSRSIAGAFFWQDRIPVKESADMDDEPDQPDQTEEHHHHDFVEEEREHRLAK